LLLVVVAVVLVALHLMLAAAAVRVVLEHPLGHLAAVEVPRRP